MRMTRTERQRVFVSSVVEGFQAQREAARRGIILAKGEPVLVNEDLPAMTLSPRTACLDAVDSCDVFLIVVGERGGWTTPSGKLVVEEELERARERRIPVLAFIQEGLHDRDTSRLVDLLSDYVQGHFRRSFADPEQLEQQVHAALQQLGIGEMNRLIRPESLLDDRVREPRFHGPACLRFVLAPERDEEVIDLLRLESNEFRNDILRIAHDHRVGLLTYEAGKKVGNTERGVFFSQEKPMGARGRAGEVYVEVRTDGRLLVDAQVSDPPDDRSPFGGLTIQTSDLERVLTSCFALGSKLYDELDRFGRFSRFFDVVSLASIDGRQLLDKPAEQTLSLGRYGRRPDPMLAEAPRLVTRGDLERPDLEVARKIALFRRQFEATE